MYPQIRTLLPVAAALFCFAAITWAAEDAILYRGYETPTYAVELAEGPAEVRRYAPYLVAEVTVQGERRGAIQAGFRALADYIFGGNADDLKVDMTTPVAQRAVDDSETLWTVRFMMPSGYTSDTLPEPDNTAIRFANVRQERQAVLRFSGRWQSADLDAREAELRAWAARHGLRTVGQPIYSFYDGPFSAPWTRRNEVALVVRPR